MYLLILIKRMKTTLSDYFEIDRHILLYTNVYSKTANQVLPI